MLKIEQVGGNKRPDLDRPFGKVCFNVWARYSVIMWFILVLEEDIATPACLPACLPRLLLELELDAILFLFLFIF